MSLRIAHVSATFPPYGGGTGNVCYHNARELASRGHDVTVLTAAIQGAPAREHLQGVVVRRLTAPLRVGNAPVLPGLVSELREFDIIHLHYPFIGGAELVRAAAAVRRTPLVVSFHNDLIGDGARATIFSLYQACSAVLTVRRAACLCAVSLDHYYGSQLSRLLAPGKPRVTELPNGVDITLFHPGGATEVRKRHAIPSDARLVLFVAALDRAHHFKGLDRALRALRELPPDHRLLVVGDGDLRQSYERQARELGVAERAVFVGAVDHASLPPYFRAADVTVLPSSPPESFGLVLIESLACGTPVIASDIPGVRTVITQEGDGLLVAEGDTAALARAIKHIAGSPEVCRAMGRRGRAKVERAYTWESAAARLEAIYAEVLRERRVRPARSAQEVR